MHENFVKVVIRGLEKNGRNISLVNSVSNSKWDVTTEEVVATPRALQIEHEEVDLTDLRAGDIVYMVEAPEGHVEPLISHRIIDGDKKWSIVEIMPFKPGERIIFYYVQGRM